MLSTQLYQAHCTFIIACFKVHPLSSTPDSYIHFATLSSFICSICLSHLNVHLSTLPDRSNCTPTIPQNFFISDSVSNCLPTHLKHLIYITFNLFLSLRFKSLNIFKTQSAPIIFHVLFCSHLHSET